MCISFKVPKEAGILLSPTEPGTAQQKHSFFLTWLHNDETSSL